MSIIFFIIGKIDRLDNPVIAGNTLIGIVGKFVLHFSNFSYLIQLDQCYNKRRYDYR